VRTLTRLESYSDEDGNEIVTGATYEKDIKIAFRGRGNRLVVADGAKIDRLNLVFDRDNGSVTIGRHTKVKGGLWGIRVGEDASIIIGENVSTTGLCIISAVEGVTVRIGDDVMIASHNQIRADDGHPIFDIHTEKRVNPAADVTIGDHVWLALGSTVLAGAHVGEGSVIGFGSIVTGRIPNNCVAVGTPARVVRRDIAWERPHLSLAAPGYKPDASTVRKTRYWNPTEGDGPVVRPRPSRPRRVAERLRQRLRRS
jgi:acetyltransferase-like isoleucine patch superfamily enzyme